ncbi:MAG: hydrogenase maturation protease [Candidatus Thermoplasmatota archaeon]
MILGVGNPIIPGDNIGLQVAEQLRGIIKHDNIKVDTACTGGLNLIDLMIGYHKVIVIDIIHEKSGAIGEVRRYCIEDIPYQPAFNPHALSLPEAFKIADKLGYHNLPREIIVIGITASTIPHEFNYDTHQGSRSTVITRAVDMILKELNYKGEEVIVHE